MRKDDLLRKISDLPNDAEIVVQKNFPDGGFQLFDFAFWPGGHIGYHGPIIHLTDEVTGIDVANENMTVSDKKKS
jgi:hypothetical protein